MRREVRRIFYVCSAIINNTLVSKMIESDTSEEAINIFEKECFIKPEVMHGPFYKKKTETLNKNSDLKFKSEPAIKGIYNGWKITAMPLENPPESVYIFFDSKIDCEATKIKPKSTIVKIKDIEEIK